MADTFSSSAENAISRQLIVEVTGEQLSDSQLEDAFEIGATAGEILSRDFKRVALQFPDELLVHSVPVYRALKARLGPGRDLYVLADTSYGSCCVDEVAARHANADSVVHYGQACLSPTSRLPVIYVFGKQDFDIENAISAFVQQCPSPSSVQLMCNVVYSYKLDDLRSALGKALPSTLIFADVPERFSPPGHKTMEPSENVGTSGSDSRTIFYIGEESLGLTNILMTNSTTAVYSYDPKARQARLESGRANRLLMRRYAVIQKARDADVVGILVGTLGVASYLPLIAHLRTLLVNAKKKSYTVSVGKLNPSKLANFMEVQCWVLVACPENSVIDAKDFLKPIITPFELQIALDERRGWTGRYLLDFERVLAESNPETEQGEGEGEGSSDDPDRPQFSLVTGRYRAVRQYGSPKEKERGREQSEALTSRNADGTVSRVLDSAAGEYLSSRTFQGLEQRVGQDAPSVLEQGRSGIARSYQDDDL